MPAGGLAPLHGPVETTPAAPSAVGNGPRQIWVQTMVGLVVAVAGVAILARTAPGAYLYAPCADVIRDGRRCA